MKAILTALLIFISTSMYTQSNTCACCDGEYRKFDFWEGNWEVRSNGKLAGTNNIYFIQDSCILLENWTGVSGSTGSSMNYYDKSDQTWNQLWVDNQGNKLGLKGQFNGKSMILVSRPTVNGEHEIIINRITWTPLENGDVRQLWESSKDGGTQWQVLFDAIYTRK